jgi:glycine dehydrogenase subunit 2
MNANPQLLTEPVAILNEAKAAGAEPLVFELSKPGRTAQAQLPEEVAFSLPKELMRTQPPLLPEISELQAVRHYTRLSRLNFSIDTQFYPLGSCTMKYNPRGCNQYAMLPELLARHPLAPESSGQGVMACLFELQDMLKEVTGMRAVSLTPMAGAQGEFAGVAMIRAYHLARGEAHRDEILVPIAAHGTNPATASMCGMKVVEVPCTPEGDTDIEALAKLVGPNTAGIMLTNPSTVGAFERGIQAIEQLVHGVGGLLYYDGANLNAILGIVRPGDMGFDVIHMNLHKTFSTPHGGGGPGAGAVGVGERLEPYLPIPMVGQTDAGQYRWLTESERPHSIGRLSAFMGNTGVLIRAYIYMRMLGRAGMAKVGEMATLNANYLLKRLEHIGYQPAYPTRRATHEFALTLKTAARDLNVTAMDIAKRLLDFGFHAPTTYFPLMIPECLLIEPTETESKETLDAFIDAMGKILAEARTDGQKLKGAPYTLPVRRLDDVRAAKQLDIRYTSTP